MKQLAMLFLLACVFAPATAHATFSVVAAERETGKIVVALATCLNDDLLDQYLQPNNRKELFQLFSVVPGVGAGVAQANPNLNAPAFIRRGLESGQQPENLIEGLVSTDFDSEVAVRQYGIVRVDGSSAAYTGASVSEVNRTAPNPDTDNVRVGPGYAIQGNVLASLDVIPAAEQAFLMGKGLELEQRVLNAMSAAAESGGDGRCSGSNYPATIVQLAVFEADDSPVEPTTLITVRDMHGNPFTELIRIRKKAHKPHTPSFPFIISVLFAAWGINRSEAKGPTPKSAL